MRIAIAITRAASMDATWTTLHLARAALARGHSIRFVEPWDFEVDAQHQVIARAYAFDPPAPTADALAAALADRTAPRRFIDLSKIDLLFLRASPLDPAVLTFAALAQDRGVRVVNDPAALLRVSHKAWLASVPGAAIPPTLVTRSLGTASVFAASQPDGVVVKPARGSGGRGVCFVKRGDPAAFDEAFRVACDRGDGYVVVQAYLPAAADGEKRLVWLDGTILGGYLRRRAPGEFRHNLSQGGQAEPVEITPTDRAAIASVTPALRAAGIRVAGFDLIGGRVTEVNALNPGGAFHTDRLHGSDVADRIITRLTGEDTPEPVLETDRWAHPEP